MNVYAVILAGGRGERLWPVSGPERPKPLLPLGGGGRSLLQAAYDRVAPLVGAEGKVYLVTDKRLAGRMRAVLDLPEEQVIVEPEGRNTAPAIGLAAAYLASADPQSVMVVLPADHLVRNEEQFRRVLRCAVAAAAEGHLVTLGINPSFPATGYGYIQRGEKLMEAEEQGVFRVARFAEKPDQETAQRYVASGDYSWNAGVFVWRVERILEEISRHLPSLGKMLDGLSPEAFGQAGRQELARRWSEITPVSVDYGIMEQASDVAMVPADVGWSDVGDWHAVWEALQEGEAEVAARGRHVGQQTARCLVWTSPGKVVATLGLQDAAVVDTPEALLVADLGRTQEIRALARAARAASPSWDELRGYDSEGMLSVLEAFPAQCRDALARGRTVDAPDSLAGFKRVLCVGMGGSGITGDLLTRLLSAEVWPHRGYEIPDSVDEETLLVGISYSGNTEETLSAFRRGLERTPRAMAISSGGELGRLCCEQSIPWIEIPSGLQPRAALGYLLLSPLPWFAQWGVVQHDVGVAIETVQAMAGELSPANPGNAAQSLAERLYFRVPLVYAGSDLTSVAAFRWKTQINENAKQPAFWAELPELCHNEIVGYELTQAVLPSACVVFLRSSFDHPRVQARAEILKEVLERRGLRYVEVWARGEGPAEQLLSLLYMGDWTSVYLALRNRVDPSPVQPIEELKERLGSWQEL
ncbi:MAG: bifunctional phosphoglucose/phosphomannose isomerase [Candidatus Bipolaricaulota bacterium]